MIAGHFMHAQARHPARPIVIRRHEFAFPAYPLPARDPPPPVKRGPEQGSLAGVGTQIDMRQRVSERGFYGPVLEAAAAVALTGAQALGYLPVASGLPPFQQEKDRKSTRLNSSHV